jgi:hypothetical protein
MPQSSPANDWWLTPAITAGRRGRTAEGIDVTRSDLTDATRTAIPGFFTGRGRSLAYVGAALALTGTGTATAAAATATPPAAVASASAGSPAKSPQAGSQTGTFSGIKLTAAGTGARQATRPHVTRHPGHTAMTWKQVRDTLAGQTYPRAAKHKLPLADRLLPAATSGPQSFMPITASRMANARTIVAQSLHKHMGIRSAVIAVATAMQESTLENITYGDRDSLGLFQQRPSCGWGSAAQITTPAYAADAFLNALHEHQKSDPTWAAQPLWNNAQAVQASGFPTAYAKWEAQAAQLVSSIARHMV